MTLYGTAFRVPTRYEWFYEEGDYFKLGPTLRSEHIHAEELVWEQRMGRDVLAIVSGYQYSLEHLIDEAVDPEDGLGYFDNTSEADGLGVEAELRAQIGARGHGYVSYAYERARETGPESRLTNSPDHLGRAGVVLPVAPRLYAAAEVVVESGRLTVYDTETDPVVLLNLNLSTTDLPGGVRGALLVRNALDETYAYPGGFEHLQPAIRQNGRDIALTVEYRF